MSRFYISEKVAKSQNPNNIIEINLDFNSSYKEGDFVSIKTDVSDNILCIIQECKYCKENEARIEDYILAKLLNLDIKYAGQKRNNLDLAIELEIIQLIDCTLAARKQMGLSTKSMLMVSPELYGIIENTIHTRGYKKNIVRIRLVNSFTGANIDYKLSDISIGNLSGDEFQINFYDRELLHLREPYYFISSKFNSFDTPIKEELMKYYL
jgi:hypothetical protein